jgi:monofunctional biosynthetic peptidoglycan transglycosylase
VGYFLKPWPFGRRDRQKTATGPPASLKRRWWVRIIRGVWTGLWASALASVLVVLALRWIPPPTSSFMVQSGMRALAAEEDWAVRYQWTPIDHISPHAALAVIAAEDQRFPDHAGFDFVALQAVWRERQAGRPLRGASTISQQVAKNLFLWSGRSLFRKGLEAWFTVWLEWLWPKQRILEVYLNIAEFGEHTFGVEAASQRFFHKPAARLTPSEAARLAAVLPNPVAYRVDRPSARVLNRQRWIERQMRQLGGVAYLNNLRAESRWNQSRG